MKQNVVRMATIAEVGNLDLAFVQPNQEIDLTSDMVFVGERQKPKLPQGRIKKATKLAERIKMDNLSNDCIKLLIQARDSLKFDIDDGRSVLNVARVIAALDDSRIIDEEHLKEAISYNPKSVVATLENGEHNA